MGEGNRKGESQAMKKKEKRRKKKKAKKSQSQKAHSDLVRGRASMPGHCRVLSPNQPILRYPPSLYHFRGGRLLLCYIPKTGTRVCTFV